MEPTLYNYEVLFVNPHPDKLVRGSVIELNDGHGLAVKRVIGMPGETISFSRNARDVYINGELLVEPYLIPGEATTYLKTKVYTLKNDQYFVMGDNRRGSMDSRVYGPITKTQIKGAQFAKPAQLTFTKHSQASSDFLTKVQ